MFTYHFRTRSTSDVISYVFDASYLIRIPPATSPYGDLLLGHGLLCYHISLSLSLYIYIHRDIYVYAIILICIITYY